MTAPRRTAHVREVRAALIHRLTHGFHAPGQRFMSNRAVAQRFGISYQTAHRLLDELAAQGLLERRGQSGTFIPGASDRLMGVEIVLHPRAQAPQSFGQKLRTELTTRLDAEGVDWIVTYTDQPVAPAPDRLPILWENRPTLMKLIAIDRPAILLNDRPPLGLGSLFIDSVSPDDFGGGVLAAQLLQRRLGPPRHRRTLAVVAGPADDPRSRLRAEGFLSVLQAPVTCADGWYYDQGKAVAQRLLRKAPQGIFCCNDRLAHAVIDCFMQHDALLPPIVGFDDAPIADRLDLTTIAIPWRAMIDAVLDITRRRLNRQSTTSSHQILNPHPVIRWRDASPCGKAS